MEISWRKLERVTELISIGYVSYVDLEGVSLSEHCRKHYHRFWNRSLSATVLPSRTSCCAFSASPSRCATYFVAAHSTTVESESYSACKKPFLPWSFSFGKTLYIQWQTCSPSAHRVKRLTPATRTTLYKSVKPGKSLLPNYTWRCVSQARFNILLAGLNAHRCNR
jgi:hypothetical protein